MRYNLKLPYFHGSKILISVALIFWLSFSFVTIEISEVFISGIRNFRKGKIQEAVSFTICKF